MDGAWGTAVLIGGPAASGKTTTARTLARARGLRWYSIDAHTWSHRARAVARGLHDDADPSPGTFDRGPLIREDLDHLARRRPAVGVIVEGALVAPDFAPLDRSVWLMPSVDEQRRRLVERSGSPTIDHGLLHGHALICDQLTGTSANVIHVDGQTPQETVDAVEAALAGALAALPSARTTAERQQVIRFGNRSLADQLGDSIAHGWIDPELDRRPRSFDCECGEPGCTAVVQLRPGEAIAVVEHPAGAIRADAHCAD